MKIRCRATLCALAMVASTTAMPGLARAQNNYAQNYGTFGADNHSCDRGAPAQVLSASKENIIGSAAGGALGGLLGNQIGKGSGNTLMTIAGVLGGALAQFRRSRNLPASGQIDGPTMAALGLGGNSGGSPPPC